MARAAVGAPWRAAPFRRFVAGSGPVSARTGDWPIAVAGEAVLAAIAARSRTVRLSDRVGKNKRGTATRQREHHPDIAPADYARVQRILDEGELFRAGPRHAMGFIEMDGRPWRAVIKATRDGSETFLATLHKAQPDDLARARRSLRRIDRRGK